MRCHLPWTQVFLNSGGAIAPCCAPMELGNVDSSTVSASFVGGSYEDLRSDLAAGVKTPRTAHCDNCYALRNYTATGYTFDVAHGFGGDTDRTLATLEGTHPEFVANYRRVREAYMQGAPLPAGSKPLRLEVQLGEHCDIRCIMCWQDHERPSTLKRGTLDELAELLPCVQNLMITGGEPTIFKSFWKLIDAFRTRANPLARLQFLTHGQHLKDVVHRFAGLDFVGFCVNIDGPTRESYERIRFGASWDKLHESLQALCEAKKTRPGWGLNTTFLLMKSNIELIAESLALARQYGAQWSCGLIAGEFQPVAQCRTYFDENIFRFAHLGYTRDEIIARLRAALPLAAENGPLAKGCLEATIEQVRQTEQMRIPARVVAELNALADLDELSKQIRYYTWLNYPRRGLLSKIKPTLSRIKRSMKRSRLLHGRRAA